VSVLFVRSLLLEYPASVDAVPHDELGSSKAESSLGLETAASSVPGSQLCALVVAFFHPAYMFCLLFNLPPAPVRWVAFADVVETFAGST